MSEFSIPGSSPLESVEESFRVLSSGPGRPWLQVGDAAGMEAQRLDPAQLARLLREAAAPVRDEVWRVLVRRARAEGGRWVVLAAGLALPGLKAVVRRWGGRSGVDREELAAEVLAQFLESVEQVDLSGPHVCQRLCYAADKAARRHCYRLRRDRHRLRPPVVEGGEAAAAGHPEQVLARAVHCGVLTAAEAELIACSRLEARSLRSAAAELGWAYSTAKWRRRRGEARLAAWVEESRERG